MAYPSPDPNDHDPVLRWRVASVLAGFAGLAALFLVYTVVEAGVEDELERVWTPATAYLAGTVALAGLLAFATAKRERTVRQVYLADGFGVLAAIGLITLTSRNTNIGYRPEFTLLIAATLWMTGRSAFVPSTARRTAVLCALAAVPIGWLTWTTYVGYEKPLPSYPEMSPAGVTFYIELWWLAASVLAVSTSHVIYGLRHEIDRARRLGQYVLEEQIGEGGMGRVYRARHAMLRRPTAVKLLVNAGESQVRRFEREVQLTASLTHPNTVAVFDYGRTPDGVFYYAMEYLPGLDLGALVQANGPLPAGRVVHILRQVCGALAEAHDAGLIHRDVKPANIILCERGGRGDVAKVLDFGLVKELDATAEDVHATSAGAVLGTPLYMSPEAIREPDAVGPRSDLYALGAVGYLLLTGRDVFTGAGVVEVCGHHLHSAPVAPSKHQPGIPEDLEALILRCLAKAPGDRPASAAALEAALAGCGSAGAWDYDRAAAWWSRREIVSRPTGAPPRSPATVAVDLSVRNR